MEKKGIIINILAVLVVLGIVFLSQIKVSTNSPAASESANSENVLTKAQDWVKNNIYPKAAMEAEKKGEELQEAVLQQKDIVAKSLWEKIKIYLAEKFSNLFGTKVE